MKATGFAAVLVLLALSAAPVHAQKTRYGCHCKANAEAKECGSSGPVDIDIGGLTRDQALKKAEEACTSGFCKTFNQPFCKIEELEITVEAQGKEGVQSSKGAKYSQATCPPGSPPGTYCPANPLSTTEVPVVIGRIINTALGLLGSVALLMFIYGGVTWLTAYGSTEKIQKGKDIMTWAVLGIILVFASFALVRFVLGAFTSL